MGLHRRVTRRKFRRIPVRKTKMKPFLVLQLRPEPEASDDEFNAILRKSGLQEKDTRRIRLEQEDISDDLSLDDYSGVIVGGGPGCVSDAMSEKSAIEARIEKACLDLMPEVTDRDFPFLGCCYGIGILAHHLGAEVSKENYSEEVGAVVCSTVTADPILSGLPDRFEAFVGHKEAVQELPEGCTHLLSSQTCPFQMIRYKNNVYATQFHPEADSAGFELRIRLYKDKGYFAPEDADRLISMCQAADVHAPEQVLRNFVTTYRSDSTA